jgi:hypothetical protein
MNPSHFAGLPAIPLKAKTSKTQFVLLAFLALFFVPMGLWGVSRAITTGFALVPTVIALLMFGSLGSVAFLVLRAYRRLPKVLDIDGIARQDGRRFAWSELQEIEHQYHFANHSPNQKLIWRIDIRFSTGTVWLIPLKVVNFAEIYRFVKTLPCEHREKNYGRSGI